MGGLCFIFDVVPTTFTVFLLPRMRRGGGDIVGPVEMDVMNMDEWSWHVVQDMFCMARPLYPF